MAGDGFSSNNADGETAPVSSGTSNKSSGTTSSTAGTTSGSTSAPGSSTTGTTSGSTSSGRTSAPGSGTYSSSGTSAGVAQQSAIGTSYVDIIMNAASESGVNPYILASMILQEQGSQGTGRSISGTVSGYQGYYNFFFFGCKCDTFNKNGKAFLPFWNKARRKRRESTALSSKNKG